MTNQYDNLNNSKEEQLTIHASRFVWLVLAAVGGAVLAASVAMPPPLAGRLHPGLVPGALGAICLAAAFAGLLRPNNAAPVDATCLASAPATLRSFGAAVVAIGVMALATRPLGVLLSVSIAGAIAAHGVRGVGVVRAILIGIGLGILATLAFVVLLRQPLPVLPGRW